MLTVQALLTAVIALPALTAAWAFGPGRRTPRLTGQLGAAVAGGGFLGAVVLAIGSRHGGVSTALGPIEFAADRLGVVLLMLVFGVSAIAQSFAVRYLAGDTRAAWFAAGAGLLTAASAGLATAATLVGLALCWTLAGAALCLLLATYRQLPAARDGVRRTAAAFLVGDLALWTAVVLATTTWGPVKLAAMSPDQFSGPLVPVVGILVVLAALSRSAQIPFHRWLPATLAAPTPVSALLHAGVVNAGGILLIRLAPMAADDLARLLIVLAGVATMIYGATIMLVKPDIKGALVHSTTAQMGFMILTCGLGLWIATVVHLVAHGFYKATLFLASGSAIAQGRRARSMPPARPLGELRTVVHAATAVFLPAAALALALIVSPGSSLSPDQRTAEKALLVFAWVTGAAVTWGWLKRRPGLPGIVGGSAFLIPVALGYVAVIHAIGDFLAPSMPQSALPAPVVWAVIAASLVLLGLLAAARRADSTGRLQRALYSRALSAGHIPTPPAMAGASS
ncbi:MAG: proton-conducting transporter membrane subunit [Mycobacterium sp.]